MVNNKSNKFKASDLDVILANELFNRMHNNSTYRAMDAICNKYGYELDEALKVSYGVKIYISIINNESFLPEIKFDMNDMTYKISTTSFGVLSIEDYKKYLLDSSKAYKCISELMKVDINTLEEENS